ISYVRTTQFCACIYTRTRSFEAFPPRRTGMLLAPDVDLEEKSMRVSRTIFAVATALCVASFPLSAASHGPAAQHGRAPTTGTHPAHPTKSTTTTTSTTSTTTTTKLNPIAAKISSRPGLNAKVSALLPSGLTLDQA